MDILDAQPGPDLPDGIRTRIHDDFDKLPEDVARAFRGDDA